MPIQNDLNILNESFSELLTNKGIHNLQEIFSKGQIKYKNKIFTYTPDKQLFRLHLGLQMFVIKFESITLIAKIEPFISLPKLRIIYKLEDTLKKVKKSKRIFINTSNIFHLNKYLINIDLENEICKTIMELI